jgi:inosose dehydratase
VIATQDFGWSQAAERAGLAWPAATEWAMQRAAEAGLTGWEPLLHTAEDAARIGTLARKHGLALTSVFVTGKLHEPAAAAQSMERMLAAVRAAVGEGCRTVSVYPSPLPAGAAEGKSDAQLDFQAGRLNALARALKPEGVQLLYHPEDPEMRGAACEFHHMLLATDPSLVGLCLDPDTIWRGAGGRMAAVLDVIRLYGHRIRELHLRQLKDRVWSETVEAGDVDYSAIHRALRACGARPMLVLEHAREPDTPCTLDPVEAHRRSLRYIEGVFGADPLA